MAAAGEVPSIEPSIADSLGIGCPPQRPRVVDVDCSTQHVHWPGGLPDPAIQTATPVVEIGPLEMRRADRDHRGDTWRAGWSTKWIAAWEIDVADAVVRRVGHAEVTEV